MPSGKPFLFLERLENEAFLFRPHALHRADTAIPGGRLEIVQRADAELAIQYGNGFRSHPLQVQQIENRGRELGDELAVKGGVAGFGNLTNPRGEILADARNLAQAIRVEECELVRMIGSDVGAIAVGANLEGILVFDLEEIGNFAKYPCNREIIQRGDLRSRSRSRAIVRRRRPVTQQSRRARRAGRNRTNSRRRPHRTPSQLSRPPIGLAR